MEDRLETVEPDTISIGDIVDIPVWMDVWYGPVGLNTDPITFASFDRVIVTEKGIQVSNEQITSHKVNNSPVIIELKVREQTEAIGGKSG